MARAVQWLEDLSGKGADLLIQCKACGHDRAVPVYETLDIFRRRRWSTDWFDAHRRFRCCKCGSKNVKLNADFQGDALRHQQRLTTLTAVAETLKKGLHPPPPGVPMAHWNRASESERRKLVERARS